MNINKIQQEIYSYLLPIQSSPMVGIVIDLAMFGAIIFAMAVVIGILLNRMR
jgi:hypothetical protein